MILLNKAPKLAYLCNVLFSFIDCVIKLYFLKGQGNDKLKIGDNDYIVKRPQRQELDKGRTHKCMQVAGYDFKSWVEQWAHVW